MSSFGSWSWPSLLCCGLVSCHGDTDPAATASEDSVISTPRSAADTEKIEEAANRGAIEKLKEMANRFDSLPRPPPELPGLTVRGSVSASEVAAVIRAHGSDVKQCARGRSEGGRVSVQWIVNSDGTVQSAKASGPEASGTSRDVHDCLTTNVKRWQFPRPEGGGIGVIRYDFEVSP